MNGIAICEVCGAYVGEDELTQCKQCKRKCCDECISFEDLNCKEC